MLKSIIETMKENQMEEEILLNKLALLVYFFQSLALTGFLSLIFKYPIISFVSFGIFGSLFSLFRLIHFWIRLAT